MGDHAEQHHQRHGRVKYKIEGAIESGVEAHDDVLEGKITQPNYDSNFDEPESEHVAKLEAKVAE